MNEMEKGRGSVSRGFFLGIGLCAIQCAITVAIGDRNLNVLVVGLYIFGLIQLVYMIPVYVLLKRRQPATANGLAIAAGVVALINVTCSVSMR